MNPRFPTISLGEAISRAKMIYEREHLSTLSPPVVAEAMGYKGINGASLRMIGALRQYGLLEGRGDDVKISKDAQTLIIDDPTSADYAAAVRRAAINPPVFSELRKQFPGPASDRNIAVHLEKKGFKPNAAAEAAKNFKETMTLVSAESEGYSGGDEGGSPASGATINMPPPAEVRMSAPSPTIESRAGGPPWRVIMNGNRLEIQASVDLAGLKKLQDVLTRYQGILEMMQPEDDLSDLLK